MIPKLSGLGARARAQLIHGTTEPKTTRCSVSNGVIYTRHVYRFVGIYIYIYTHTKMHMVVCLYVSSHIKKPL